MQNIHASSIKYKDKGLLIIGPSGVGKSDLCFRLIMSKKATMIADDRTDIEVRAGEIYALCPKVIKGLLEVRGIGLKEFKNLDEAKIDLVIELVKDICEVERLPEPEVFEYKGIKLPKIKLYSFESSVLEKIDILL
ncbi:MAG: HPr kinase/phosphatase C-terminal domain-containing protein [Lactobacillaceae bacterium]|jgi:HPr kinase/phosphorylase|nr:HPr kinase/phosphatase C-terminal domain-containing protein [Lactobacillaceae bacterium]